MEKEINIKKQVFKNNATSGKVTLPKKLIGKKVIISWREKENETN